MGYYLDMKHKNLPLLVGIALPVIFIIIMVIIIFTPALFVKPGHNFIYTNDSQIPYNQSYRYNYTIKDSHIDLTPVTIQEKTTVIEQLPKLYLYDVKAGASHEVSFAEVQKLTLDPGPSSPDGYSVNYDYSHSGIFELFGSRGDDSGYYISKGNGKKRLGGLSTDRYNNNFKLIGWVK